jgi:glycosyltransferase involved in cell wall biosynthesis
MPAVSVIVNSYNQAEYLEDCINSVLNQTFQDWELLVVDNGSTDGSQALLQKFAAHPKVRLILHPENKPPTIRKNHALSLARGEFVSLLYSDDYYLPNKLQVQMEAFAGQPKDCGVVYTPGYRLNVDTDVQSLDATNTTSGWILGDLLEGLTSAFINPISPLMRHECFERYPFQEDLFFEGENIFFRFALSFKFLYLPIPTVVMRDHARNAGRAFKKNVPEILTCLERVQRSPELTPHDAATLRRVKTNFYRHSAWIVLRVANDRQFARDMFLQALTRDWRQGLHPKTFVGLGMTLLPSNVLARLNALGFLIKRTNRHVNYVGH